MRKLINVLLITGFFLPSCKKDTGVKTNSASLTIVNGTADIPTLAVNFSNMLFIYQNNKTFITDKASLEFALPLGSNSINLISTADTTKNLVHETVNLTGIIYSYFLTGKAGNYETILLEDHIPTYADSVAGARFINLVSDSQPLSINLVGNATADFSSLAYKKITAFKKYPATTAVINNGGYNYEVRDVQGSVLTTFNWNPATFKNNTLVITGLVANGSVSVFAVNNY